MQGLRSKYSVSFFMNLTYFDFVFCKASSVRKRRYNLKEQETPYKFNLIASSCCLFIAWPILYYLLRDLTNSFTSRTMNNLTSGKRDINMGQAETGHGVQTVANRDTDYYIFGFI